MVKANMAVMTVLSFMAFAFSRVLIDGRKHGRLADLSAARIARDRPERMEGQGKVIVGERPFHEQPRFGKNYS